MCTGVRLRITLDKIMPAKKKTPRKRATLAKTTSTTRQQTRLWLMFPPRLIREPVIWKLSQKFPVVTNIRQASVTDQIGIVCLEIDGKRRDVKRAIRWLEKLGINVDPIEISVIES